MNVFTYKDQSVDLLVLLPKLWSLIQLVQLVDPLQHHLVGFTCKWYYALKAHKNTQVTSDTLTDTEWSIRNWLIQIIKQLLLMTVATGVNFVLYCTFNRMTIMGCPSLFLNIFSHRRSWNTENGRLLFVGLYCYKAK